MPSCKFGPCDRDAKKLGLCGTHYEQSRRGAKLTEILSTRPVAVRFSERHDKGPGCWEWRGFIADNGYGIMARKTGTPYAHRIAWEIANGPIPDGKFIDHQCFNKSCVNPDHLAVVTTKQNMENRPGPQVNSTTGVRGVFKLKSGKYRVQITHSKKAYGGGSFDLIGDAEAAAIALRNELFTNNLLDRN